MYDLFYYTTYIPNRDVKTCFGRWSFCCFKTFFRFFCGHYCQQSTRVFTI